MSQSYKAFLKAGLDWLIVNFFRNGFFITLANELTNNFGYTSIGTAVIAHETVLLLSNISMFRAKAFSGSTY